MGKMPLIIPVTDLRQGAAKALRQIKSSGEPVVITQRGRGAAVLMSLEAYERSERERELLRLLARGEREIATGKGFELEKVLADADDLLAREPR